MPKQFIKVKINCDVNPSGMPPEKQECTKYDSSSNISNSNGDICRICHCEADLDNPLLSPCYCCGSLKYVHQSCLRQWLAASDTRSCELCKFNFILHTKIKPLSEWRRLEMSGIERRRLLCAILFHFVAAVCVIWSLFVLIDRAAEEVQRGLIAWPFWTKLVVVAVGFTGGAVFMYIQCRQYLHLFSRWKAYNRIILVQNAPEKPSLMPPSTSFTYDQVGQQFPPQIHAHVEYNVPSTYAENSHHDHQLCYSFEKEVDKVKLDENSSTSSLPKDDIQVEDLCERTPEKNEKLNINICNQSLKNLRMMDRDILALDIQHPTVPNVEHTKTENIMKKSNSVFISLPNLNASSESLLQ